MSPARPWPRLALAVGLFAAALLLPTVPLAGWGPAGPSKPDVYPGWATFLLTFIGLARRGTFWMALPGAVANLAFVGALLAGLLRFPPRSRALALVAVAAALACPLQLPGLLPRPGWWVWTASFAVLTVPGVAWWRSAPRPLTVEAAHAAAVAAPVAALGCAALLPRAHDWVPLAVLLPPPVAVVVSCAVSAWLCLLGLRRYIAPAGSSNGPGVPAVPSVSSSVDSS